MLNNGPQFVYIYGPQCSIINKICVRFVNLQIGWFTDLLEKHIFVSENGRICWSRLRIKRSRLGFSWFIWEIFFSQLSNTPIARSRFNRMFIQWKSIPHHKYTLLVWWRFYSFIHLMQTYILTNMALPAHTARYIQNILHNYLPNTAHLVACVWFCV